MSDPGFARPDLCSICAADEQAELAEAVRGGLSADGHPPARRLPACTRDEQHRPRHPPVHGGGRARRGGHRSLCLLLARLCGRPGPRRERDHRPAGAGHDRRPRLRQFDGGAVRGTAPGPGTLPGALAARPGYRGDPHGEHGPGLVPRSWSGRWSRPGRRSVSWAPMSSWSGSSARPGQ